MTTNDDTINYCRGCGMKRGKLIHPLTSEGYCVTCAGHACEDGEGERVGLPAVPADRVEDVIGLAGRTLIDDEDDTLVNGITTWGFCTECHRDTEDIPEEDEDHVIVCDVVLIGCEGFHTAAFRALWVMLNG